MHAGWAAIELHDPDLGMRRTQRVIQTVETLALAPQPAQW
jgi:hypothetical protein